jgi:phosphomannomutase
LEKTMTQLDANQTALLDAVRAFHQDDPDEVTRAELQALLDKNDLAGLQARFAAPLTFGTAGLRGEIGAGPARMNRAVVARATAGLCVHMLEANPKARERGLCIGFDGRRMSRELAEETAAVAAGYGILVHIFDEPVPTPVLAFAVLDVGAAAGVMVTASHNPAADNGYKAYWDNGAQVIPPHDRGTEDAMAQIKSVKALKRLDKAERIKAGLQRAVGQDVADRYLKGVAEIGDFGSKGGRNLPIVYTALHGVGGRWVKEALTNAGFTNLQVVAEQFEPHPDFPTVAFPNPEEPGAMDRSHALAQKINAALVLANDPDADRLAIAARAKNGELVAFTGNELGALLTEHLLTRAAAQPNKLILSSIVSSPIVGVIAKAHGARWEPTLTGFKWIANRAIELRKQNIEMVLGLEEALGYSAGALVRDKDGVSTALCVASIAAELHEKGQSLVDALDQVFAKYGAFVSGQVSLKAAGLDGPAKMAAVMARARANPPSEVAGCKVSAIIDLKDSSSTGTPSFDPRTLPSSDVVIWELGEHGRICLRPSGTEPKLKLYLDAASRVQPGEAVATARARATKLMNELSADARKRLDL